MKTSILALLTAATLSFASMGAVYAQEAMAPAATAGMNDCLPDAASPADTGGTLSGASTEDKGTEVTKPGDDSADTASEEQQAAADNCCVGEDGAVAPADDTAAATATDCAVKPE
jgi:hypothetical protein